MKIVDNQYLKNINSKRAIKFVILLGCVSLFSDMTYESARSINGQFLNMLGRSASTIGWVAGVGELLGYGLRLISGYLADKTKKYWLVAFMGYLLNLLSVPLLAWVGLWQIAVGLMIMERIGKAIRTPARDAMLSYGANEMGQGWGFGLHEAMDQGGATIGPLLVSAVLIYRNQSYHDAYLFLTIPAIIALCILFFASRQYPNPEHLELKADKNHVDTWKYTRRYWVYLAAMALIAAGYADFPLIAYHFKHFKIIHDQTIPIFYSVAMASDAVSALILGKLYDKIGIWAIRIAIIVSLTFTPLVFFGGFYGALLGMIAWGIGMGAQESIVKAEVAKMVPPNKRGSAFGLFNTGFGIFWFLGSVIMGYLYNYSVTSLVIFSLWCQGLAVIIVFMLKSQANDVAKLKS